MIKKKAKKDHAQKKFSDLVGIDFSTTATKVVRLKSNKGELSLVGIDLMPAVDFGTVSTRMDLPRNISTYYSCLSYTGTSAVVRMVNAQLGATDEGIPDAKLRQLLNVTDDFRVSARIINRGKGRQDTSLLAAAIPEDDVRFLLNMFPAGPPAPASLEVSGLSFVSAFLHARGAETKDETVCVLETGETVSHFAFIKQGQVTLVGKMPLGAQTLRSKLMKDLGVDEDLAGSILEDRSINISASLSHVLDPFIKQLNISKDFIERHQGCRVARVYVSGGLSLLPSWSDELGKLLHSEISLWSPLENIHCDDEILTTEMKQQATRFTAAIGAAIGGFEIK